MSTPVIPRNPLGEWGYRGLWLAVAVLPALLLLIRYISPERGIVWFLFWVLGVPAIVVLQALLAMTSWVYRRRQWRHWLGNRATISSFVYYGLWGLLALAMPDGESGQVYPSLMQRILGEGPGEILATILMWAVGIAYVSTLTLVIVEGEQAVATDPSGRTVKAIIGDLFSQK